MPVGIRSYRVEYAEQGMKLRLLGRQMAQLCSAEPASSSERKVLRIQWTPDTDSKGRSIMRLHWVEEVERAEW